MRNFILVILGSVSLMAGCASDYSDASYMANAGPTQSRLPETPLPDPSVAAGGFVDAKEHPLSTFSVDVDTGSYSLVRSALAAGSLPEKELVRSEEFLNYFDYGDAPPTDDRPFAVHVEGAPSPFGENLSLLRIALKGKEIAEEARTPYNLVFLVDVSGSMSDENKLPLVKYSLRELVNQLKPTDTLGLVVYAGTERVVLEPTAVSDKGKVTAAIDALGAGGSTAGEAGSRMAYELAEKGRVAGSTNRVVLCTDGDFNVGLTGQSLIELIEQKRDTGITLTTLGFGRGNYKDSFMEQLADHGNGNYAYIDSQDEALRVLRTKLAGTMQVIAKDTKIQVAFDPDVIRRYRLIGYENRRLANEDFKNDQKDAGEIGSGHTVVALYEAELRAEGTAANLATVNLRYKLPEGTEGIEFAVPFARASLYPEFSQASSAFRFGAAVVELAEILGKSPHSTGARFDDVLAIANASGPKLNSDRDDFVALGTKAKALFK